MTLGKARKKHYKQSGSQINLEKIIFAKGNKRSVYARQAILSFKRPQTPALRKEAEERKERFMPIFQQIAREIGKKQETPMVFVNNIQEAKNLTARNGIGIFAKPETQAERKMGEIYFNNEKNAYFLLVETKKGFHFIVFIGKEASEEKIRKVAKQMLTDRTRTKEFEQARKKFWKRLQ